MDEISSLTGERVGDSPTVGTFWPVGFCTALEGPPLGKLEGLLVGIVMGSLVGCPVMEGELEGTSLGAVDGNCVGAVVSKVATCSATILPAALP